MSDIQNHIKKSTEPPRLDNEKDAPVFPTEEINSTLLNIIETAAPASGDRVLVLMDLDNGLVGWESADDPENPQ
jgi:hypothetical protein